MNVQMVLHVALALLQPELPMKFNIASYESGGMGSDYESFPLEGEARANRADYCGTAACVIGMTPLLTGMPKRGGEQWFEYSERVFGLLKPSEVPSEQRRINWAWMFSGDWALFDNTAQGAARRMLLHILGESHSPYFDDHEHMKLIVADYKALSLEDLIARAKAKVEQLTGAAA